MKIITGVVFVLLMPLGLCAQVANDIHSLHAVLDQLYNDMLPLCSQLIGVGRGIAGFAATWYIAARVWRHIANAEPIDFYPLFRPFVLGFAVMIFPSVIAMINGVMQPTVTGTNAMLKGSDAALKNLLALKEASIKKSAFWQMYVGASGEGDRDKWYQYTYDEDPSAEGWAEGIGHSMQFAMSKAYYQFKNTVKAWLSEVLKVVYEAAALCINTIRTFQLLVLAILGPLVLGLAVFDGFQHTLTVWLARYLNIFLWLPVANIFGAILGKIQENMLKIDISQIEDQGDTFFSSTDIAYLIFLIIGIVGYACVPGIANYIIHAGGGNGLVHKVTTGFMSASRSVVNTSAAHSSSMVKDEMGDARRIMSGGFKGLSDDYFKDRLTGK